MKNQNHQLKIRKSPIIWIISSLANHAKLGPYWKVSRRGQKDCWTKVVNQTSSFNQIHRRMPSKFGLICEIGERCWERSNLIDYGCHKNAFSIKHPSFNIFKLFVFGFRLKVQVYELAESRSLINFLQFQSSFMQPLLHQLWSEL